MTGPRWFSEACQRNREPILAVLRRVLAAGGTVLEVGSGTGQHAVHFAAALPGVVWQTSDLPENHPGIREWLDDAGLSNALPPLDLDVTRLPWPVGPVDAVFCANVLHIVSWSAVESLFQGMAGCLKPGGAFCCYGPFNYGGRFTSESNARFDASLRARDSASGIRDFERVDGLARNIGLRLEEDVAMPANNRALVWRRSEAATVGHAGFRR